MKGHKKVAATKRAHNGSTLNKIAFLSNLFQMGLFSIGIELHCHHFHVTHEMWIVCIRLVGCDNFKYFVSRGKKSPIQITNDTK